MKNILQMIFSIKNNDDKKHKTITIIGIRINLKKIKKTLKYNPFGLIVDTTMLCNNNCSFCWRHSNPEYLKECNEKYKIKTMPFEIFKKIIDDACQYDSIKWFTCCGPMGEPLLNENIEKFYEYAFSKNHFNSLTINTNGLAIDKKNISKLLNSITEFSISVDSIIPETYEKIHGHKNINKIIENIKLLVEYKKNHGCLANIIVRFTENDLNRGQIDDFVKFFKDAGVDGVNYCQEHSFAGVNTNIIDEKSKYTCKHPREILNFDFLGNLTTCCLNWHMQPIFGNIKYKSIKQMWESNIKQTWNDKTRFNQNPCLYCSAAESSIAAKTRSKRITFKNKETING